MSRLMKTIFLWIFIVLVALVVISRYLPAGMTAHQHHHDQRDKLSMQHPISNRAGPP